MRFLMKKGRNIQNFDPAVEFVDLHTAARASISRIGCCINSLIKKQGNMLKTPVIVLSLLMYSDPMGVIRAYLPYG